MESKTSVEASTTVNKDAADLRETEVPIDETDYSEESARKAKFSNYLRVFTYTTLSDKILLGFAFLGQIGTGATLPLMNIVFGNLAGNFAEYFVPGSGVTRAQFDKSLNKQTLYIVYLFVARWVLGYCSLFVFRIVGLRMSAKLRLEYLRALFSLPVSVLDTLPSGQASNTITTTANTLQMGISDKLGQLVQSQSLLVAATVISFKYSWALTLVTSSVLVFIVIVYGSIIPIIVKLMNEVMFADEKAASIAGEVLGSVRMIVACGAEGRIAKRYNGWVEESRKRGLRVSPFIGAQFAPLFFSIYAAMALCFWYGFKLYREHHIDSVGTIVIVLMSMMILATSLGQASAPIVAVVKATSASCDFFAIIDAPKPATKSLKHPEASAQEDIRFESVDFAYPSRPHVKVLDNLSVKFDTGKITAIVGASGSGKSTLVGLIERWYALETETIIIPKAISGVKDSEDKEGAEVTEEPTNPVIPRGSIEVGVHAISDFNLKWWRSQIGLVQQEPFVFNDTIAKNVEYGLIGSPWENEDLATKRMLIEQACKEAFADEFISKLPLGYETQVGDAGIKLSGGQRQRLAIARSIVKRPKILILDEATSAIDVRGEKLVQAALDRVSEGRTTITIAHRLSTIKKADKIVVMKKGRVVEEGTHESLLQDENGVYFALVNAQQLSMDETFLEDADAIDATRMEVIQQEISKTDKGEDSPGSTYKPTSLIRSFGLLMFEQRHHWFWYSVLVATTIATGGKALVAAINYWSLMFFVLALGIGMGYFLLGMSSQTISTEYFESILAKPIAFFDEDENSSGTLTARVSSDPTQLQQLLGINMALAMNAVFSLIGSTIIAFVFGWKLTLVAIFVALPIIITGAFIRIRYEILFEKMNQAVFEESSKFAAESISAFRTVTSLTLEDMICERYEILLADHVNKAFKKARHACLIFAGSDSFPLLCMALTFWYGGRLLANREYDPISFFVVYVAVILGSESAGQFLSFGPNMAQAAAAANRILSFRVRDTENNKGISKLQDTTGGIEIELKDVWFKYPTRDIPIFTGLNIKIEKGKFAALVGASGCGKTSIVSLLERFYEVQKGKILCNGTNIADIDLAEYRKAISLVAQEPTLFQGTIKQNVLLGVSESTPDELIHQACRDAEIHEFIMSLPDGYATDVGTKGFSLSGGQKQRLSIARALIRNPKILLLDEATSSLDSESEKLVQAAFERAASGRTMVVVAHRLATVQNANVIFVLGEGKVLEMGNHENLLRQRGVYYSMCQSQALDR